MLFYLLTLCYKSRMHSCCSAADAQATVMQLSNLLAPFTSLMYQRSNCCVDGELFHNQEKKHKIITGFDYKQP